LEVNTPNHQRPIRSVNEAEGKNEIAFINEGDPNPVVDIRRASAKSNSEKSLRSTPGSSQPKGIDNKNYNKMVEKYIMDGNK
jgi:hypothetical protein